MHKENLQKTKGEMFQGTLDPISIFPEEVWEMILDRVSSIDRLATCRTNSQLDTAFGKCKNQWLFDQVLPFIIKHFTQKAQLLKCRQVCKNWRHIVNSFLESEHPCRRFYQKDHLLEQVFCRMPTIYSSLRRCGLEHLQFTPKSIHKFSSCPDPTGPLVGRALSLYINGWWVDEQVEEFWIAARSFLELQGVALWHFKFVMYSDHWTTERFYLILWECLNLLPNLRTLEIRCVLKHFDKIYNTEERKLAQLIAANPMPVSPYLHFLDIECVPLPIQQHFILQFSTQLKRLTVDMDDFDGYKLNCTLLENLVELSIKGISSDDLLRRLYNRETILRNCHKLTLDMSSLPRVEDNDLLRVLMQYPQLKHIRLVLHSYSRYRRWSHSEDQVGPVPSVEYFEIEGNGLDLFHYCAWLHKLLNLKYLHIRDTSLPGHDGATVVSSETAKVEIEQYLDSHRLEECPIWDTLDELEVLTFESERGSLRRFCNREQVKHYRERMGTYDKNSM